MTEELELSASAGVRWPEDLRQLVGERRLIELSLEAAQFVGETLWGPAIIMPDEPGPRTLLTLLTYCYGSGICGSEEIERACGDDPSVRYLCSRTFPNQEMIRRFRRANRPWLEACLLNVYANAFSSCEAEPGLDALVRRKIEAAIMTDTALADCY